MKSLAILTIFCAAASAAPKLELIHAAAGSYGVQKVGEDAGPLYAFVKVESAKAEHMAFKTLFVERDGKRCATLTKLDRIAVIPEVKDKTAQLRLDANTGTPYNGELAKGTTWLRIEAVMDHQCRVDKPILTVRFDTVDVKGEILEALAS